MWEITVRFMGERLTFKSEEEPFRDDGFVVFEDFETKRTHKFADCEMMIIGPED